jgi:HAE1 family hydrophobic/amphiphilic exporter-1
VAISLVVSVMVIPPLAARVLGKGVKLAEDKPSGFAVKIADLITWINRRMPLRIAIITLFVAGSLAGSYFLKPPTDYLPSGNRNLVFGFVLTEPGLSVEEFEKLALEVESKVRPYWEAEPDSPAEQALPPSTIMLGGQKGEPASFVEVPSPAIENFFFVTRGNTCFMGATSRNPDRVKPLISILTNAVAQSEHGVGTIPIFFQTALFGGIRSGNSVDVEIRGDDLDQVTASASTLFREFRQAGFNQIEPDPTTFDLPRPEIRAVPDRVRAADVGLNVRDIGFVLL